MLAARIPVLHDTAGKYPSDRSPGDRRLFLGQRCSFNPLAILKVTPVGCNFADIDFRIEVGGKRITMVARVGINNINRMDFVKIMLLRISREHTGYTRSKPLPSSAVIPAFSNLSL